MTSPINRMEQETTAVLRTSDEIEREPVQDKFEVIRGLLVGNEFEALNDRLRDLRQVHEASFDKIQANFMAELKSIQTDGKAEIREVSEMVVEMIGQLQNEDNAQAEGMRNLGNEMAALEEQVQDIAQALTNQMEELRAEITGQMSNISRTLAAQQKEITQNSVSRTNFATILSGLAGSLAPQPVAAEETA